MPNKMIPSPFEIKIILFDFCYYGSFYSNTQGQSGSLLLFYFFISIVMALGRMV